jgi:alpha-L-rhamnosidase
MFLTLALAKIGRNDVAYRLIRNDPDTGLGAGGLAYKKIVIAPTPGGKLTSADVRYDSIRGRIETGWKKSGDKLTLNVTIPANTTATVLVPAKSADAITESGKPLAKATGVKFVRMDGDRAVLEVEAGSYRFAAKTK